jgi:hypothetical protein
MTRLHRLFPSLLVALALPAAGCTGTATTPATDSSEPAPARAEVRGPTAVNAGEVDYARPHDYTFTVANTGGSPLDLTLTRKSCSCAEVTMPGPIAPGAEGKIVVKWAPIPGNVGAYTVWADVKTNAPQTKSLRLEVKSHIHPLVHVFVEGKENNSYVDFGDEPVAPGQPRVRELQVFSTKLDHFDLEATTALPGFEIKKTPLAVGSPAEGARCGYALEMRTTDKLPFGYVRTELRLALRKMGSEPDRADRTLTIPVYAVIGNAIFSVGRPGKFLFRKPNITDEDTARLVVTFILPQTQKESVKVQDYEPKFLKVDEPESLGHGKWRMTVHMPKDNPEAAKLQPDPPMLGQVVLEVAGLPRPVPISVRWDPLPK